MVPTAVDQGVRPGFPGYVVGQLDSRLSTSGGRSPRLRRNRRPWVLLTSMGDHSVETVVFRPQNAVHGRRVHADGWIDAWCEGVGWRTGRHSGATD
jgi:hypothetical protein